MAKTFSLEKAKPRTRAILDHYIENGRDRKATTEAFGLSESTLRSLLCKYQLNGDTVRPLQQKTLDILAALENGMPRDKVAEKFNVRRNYIRKVLSTYRDRPLNGTGGYVLPEEIRRMQKKIEKRPLPTKGKVKRYILTCAQNNIKISPTLWENIQALAKHYDAEILVSSITYAKTTFGKLNAKRGTDKGDETKDSWWDEKVVPYLDEGDKNIQLGNNLVWFGMLNILPTTVAPLAGYEVLTGTRSTIIPHNKLAFKSVPQQKNALGKFICTTGILTKASYLERSAGHKAIPHHTIGCLVAEIDSDGNHWVRQVHAHHTDDLHDLTLRVSGGKVQKNQEVESVVWGDIHTPFEHKEFREAAWGKKGFLDRMKPKYQFFHDVLDFRARNHHERNNPHENYSKYISGQDSIYKELEAAAGFLQETRREGCRSIVVDSNHDNAFTRYLREVDWRTDMPNATLNLEANLQILHAREKGKRLHVLEWALQNKFNLPRSIKFLRQDESLVIKNIEHGMHGHLGINGARGSAQSLRNMGKKATIGHSHVPAIIEGLWQVGTSSQLDLGYNVGPSSWSLTCCVLYKNGKRSLVTFNAGKFHA